MHGHNARRIRCEILIAVTRYISWWSLWNLFCISHRQSQIREWRWGEPSGIKHAHGDTCRIVFYEFIFFDFVLCCFLFSYSNTQTYLFQCVCSYLLVSGTHTDTVGLDSYHHNLSFYFTWFLLPHLLSSYLTGEARKPSVAHQIRNKEPMNLKAINIRFLKRPLVDGKPKVLL